MAAVVAESRYVAEDARELIEVEYTAVPRPDPPPPARPAEQWPNLAGRVSLVRRVEAVLRAAPGGLGTPPHRGGGQPMETRRLVADSTRPSSSPWASSQVPHQISKR